MKIAPSHRALRRGFTLIEMLTVIAILGILIGLLFIPLTASFRFVGREERDIKLQNVTREALRLVTGTLAQAMEINTLPANPTRVDLVLPAAVLINQPSGYTPSVSAGTAAEPGQLWETFFVGLQDPTKPYNNPVARKTSGGLVSVQNTDENEYVLWRAIYNLNDPNDPVAKALNFNAANLATAPWGFDDSLKLALANTAANTPTPFAQVVNSANSQTLLMAMANYTARYIPLDATGTPIPGAMPIPVGAQLTPVVTSGHLDAVRSRWDTANNGWLIDPRVSFLPDTSQNEVLAPSEFGTQFQSSRGQWIVTGAANPSVKVFWGPGYFAQYGAANIGNINATWVNGPNAGMPVASGSVPPFVVDPRTGRITMSQFQVTETIPVTLNQNNTSNNTVYPIPLPNGADANTAAMLVDNNGNSVGTLHPQIIPYSDTLKVVTNTGGNQTSLDFQRAQGNITAIGSSPGQGGENADEVAQGNPPLDGAGTYAINYVCSPDIRTIMGANADPFAPPANQNYIVPVIQIPNGALDTAIHPNAAGDNASTQLMLTYRFTFSTLDVHGNPMVSAVASYASQRFVHVAIGFRNFDESTSTPSDYSLSTSIGTSNPTDEQPAGE